LCFGIGDDVHYTVDGINNSFTGLGTPAGNTPVNVVFGNLTDNFGGLYGANDMEYRSMYLTYGISTSEAIILSQIDNAFQTQLGRNTY
jgi:hypothetical protein